MLMLNVYARESHTMLYAFIINECDACSPRWDLWDVTMFVIVSRFLSPCHYAAVDQRIYFWAGF
jgi:hypothetical protein